METKKTKYLNPYVGGVLLGLVLLAANFISGRGLGASGAMKSVVVTSITAVAPSSSGSLGFVKEFRADHPFLFLIRDHGSGTILFLEDLAEPAFRVHRVPWTPGCAGPACGA